jgi:DNA-binding transcriptional MerR regulator
MSDGQVVAIRIGELSERSGVSRRLLRYYEDQGLLAACRESNGYRSYDARLVDRVAQIRGLLDSGIPTRIIRLILPCLDLPGVLVCPEQASPEIVDALEREHALMSARITTLTRNRDAVGAYLANLPR